jgi:hypothetical protein
MTKTIIAAITCPLLVGILHAECVLMTPLESSGHIRIHVAIAGKPLAGAKIIFHSSHDCTCGTDAVRGNPLDTSMFAASSSSMSDENGTANLELAPGDYDVAATINEVASTTFVGIHVSDKAGVTALPLDLTLQAQRIEEPPVRFQVAAFRGTVKDSSGAVLPEARIVVVKRGSLARDVVLKDKADASGKFSSQLTEGSYIAVVFGPRGFRPAIVPFEITRTGSGELPINLTPGSCP